MADEHVGQRQDRPVLWTKIFSAFRLALDAKKLALAAAGILATAFGWWLLAIIFYSARSQPQWKNYAADQGEGAKAFLIARARWNLLYELAGPPDSLMKEDATDLARNPEELLALEKIREPNQTPEQLRQDFEREPDAEKRAVALGVLDRYLMWSPIYKPAGRLRTWPWFEERGPNPYLLVSQTIKRASPGEKQAAPWPPGQYASYFFVQLVPVLLEPLFKLLAPVVYLFDARAGWLEHFYLALVILYTLAVWGFFGGAITRIAAVQFARNERISLRESLRFAADRFISFFSAPVLPLGFVLVLTIALIVYGLFQGLIPVFGDIFMAGLLWPIVLIVGLIMAVVLVGLVGWPLMYATISTEASDSFDALSRSYSYVYGAPWHYLWYAVVAAVYGAVVVFFITFMGSLLVYLGKWGVAQTPFVARWEREPSYLFVYAPTSFGWRDLLIHDNPAAAQLVAGRPYGYEVRSDYYEKMTWYNKIGAVMVSIWIYLFFLLIIGFSYSFFWSASTIIYFLMRRHVDDTDLDEVHMEAEGLDEPFTKPAVPADAKPNTISLTTIEAPAARPPASPAAGPSEIVAPPPVQASATASPPTGHEVATLSPPPGEPAATITPTAPSEVPVPPPAIPEMPPPERADTTPGNGEGSPQP